MKSARETISGEQTAVLNPLQQLDQTRFFVQMGWNVLTVDTHAIPNQRLLRGEITPLRSYQAKDNIMAIVAGDLIPGSEETDPTGRGILYGKYWRHALHEAERLISIEQGSEYKTGLVEIKSLRDIPQLYDQIDLTALIYDNTWPNLPEKNSDLLEFLREQRETLEGRDIPRAVQPILLNVYTELMDAVIVADQIQSQRVQQTHNRMKLSPMEPGAKSAYDAIDREMLIRTGLPEIHTTDISVAKTLELMRERAQPNDGLNELAKAIAALAEQTARQNEAQQVILQTLAITNTPAAAGSVADSRKK